MYLIIFLIRSQVLIQFSYRNYLQQTHATRVRVAILAAYGEAYCRENKGSRYRLVSHEPRPSLTIFPADSEKRPMSFRFIDAVQRLVANFSKAEWSKIYDKVGTRLHLGQLRRVFVVLHDDERVTSGGQTASGANAEAIGAPDAVRGRQGLRKRPADGAPGTTQTPVKSSRGRFA